MEKHVPYTDSYFLRSRKIIQLKGDAEVTYACFMRRPVTYAPKIAVNWIKEIISSRVIVSLSISVGNVAISLPCLT